MKPGFAPSTAACEAPGDPVSPGVAKPSSAGWGSEGAYPGVEGLSPPEGHHAGGGGGGGTAPSDSRTVRSWSPPPSSCIARLRVLGRGDHHCGKTYFVFYEQPKSPLSRQSPIPLSLSWGTLYLIFVNSNRIKEDPLFLRLFFLGVFLSSSPSRL